MEADRRRQRAVDAALAVARRLGLADMDPSILHDSNNTLVHLRPYPIVAKVGTTPLAGRADGLRRELRLLVFLAAADAPTVRPTTIVPPGPHDHDGLPVILLDFAAAVSEEPSPTSRAQALEAVHAALVEFHDPLPSYLDTFTDTAAVAADPNATPTLSADDRAFLAWAHEGTPQPSTATSRSNQGVARRPVGREHDQHRARTAAARL